MVSVYDEVRRKFEFTVNQNSIVAKYLKVCVFNGEQYELADHDHDMMYMEDRLNGAWWAFQEQERSVNLIKGWLGIANTSIENHKDRIAFLEARLARQAQTIALLQGRKTRAEAAKDFDSNYE